MPKLTPTHLRGDIYGGVTAAIVALPLALAFGVASGAGPVAGMYGAIFVGLFAALFGGTPAQISGPTGPMTVVMAATFTEYVGRDPVHGPALAFTVVMLGGLFQILFGLLKLGRYINLGPYAVISGFMSGIGVIIIVLQLPPLLGHAAPSGGVPTALAALPGFVADPGGAALLLGTITLVIVYGLPAQLQRLLPAPLLALVVGTLLLVQVLPEGSASRLGDIPTGIPRPSLPTFEPSLLVDMVKSALVLAVLGAIDSLLTSLVADNITRSHHDSDRELIGQGIGNTVAGVFGGLPGAGATMRTVVNIRAGGRTRISGALHALLLLAIVLGAGGAAEYIPHAVLAGILIKVGLDIIDWDFLRHLHRTPATSIAMMFGVLLLTVFVDLITAVAAGVVAAALLLVKRMADLQAASTRLFSEPGEEAPLDEEESRLLARAGGRVLIYHLSGPLSFGAAKDMVRRLAGQTTHRVLLLDFTAVPFADYTSARAIDDIIRTTRDSGREVWLCGLQQRVGTLLEKTDVLAGVPVARRCPDRRTALQRIVAG